MPVPDHVSFGPADNGGQVQYGDVRRFPEDDQFTVLQRRLAAFYFSQVHELAKQSDGKHVVYSPFPLFLLTCVGIETLGKVFFGRKAKDNENKEDVQRQGFLLVCARMDQRLSRPLSKEQKEKYDELWGAGEHKRAETPATILYRLGRHTMVHGYRGKGTYISGEIEKFDITDGSLIVNPYWLWSELSAVYDVLWHELLGNKEQNSPMRASMRLYVAELLG